MHILRDPHFKMQNIYWPTFNFLAFLQGQRHEPLNISILKKNCNKGKKLSCTQCCNIFDIEFDLHDQIFFSNSWSVLFMNLIFVTKSFLVFLGHFFASNWIFMSRSFWVILGQVLLSMVEAWLEAHGTFFHTYGLASVVNANQDHTLGI